MSQSPGQGPGQPPQMPGLPPVQFEPINAKGKIYDMQGNEITSKDAQERYFANAANQAVYGNRFNQSTTMPMQLSQPAQGATVNVQPTETTQDTQSDLNAELHKYSDIFNTIFNSLSLNNKCELDETITNKIKIERQTDELEEKRNIIEENKDKLEKEQKHFETSISAVEEEKNDLKNKLFVATKQVTELKTELENKASKANEETPDKGEIEQYKKKIQELEENVRNLTTELQEKSDTISNMQQKSEGVLRNTEILSGVKDENAEEIEKLKKKLKTANDLIEQKEGEERGRKIYLKEKIEETSGEEKRKYELQLQELINNHEQQKKLIEINREQQQQLSVTEINSFKEQIRSLSASREQVEKDLLVEKTKNQHLKSRSDDIIQENNSMMLDAQKKMDQLIHRHSHDMQKKGDKLKNTEQEREEARAEASKAKDDKKALEVLFENSKETQERNQREQEKLVKKNQELETEKVNLDQKLKDLSNHLSEYDRQIKETQSELDELKNSNDSEKKKIQIDNLKNDLERLQGDVKKCNEEKADIEKSIEALDGNLSSGPQKKKKFMYGLHWERIPNQKYAILKEYTGDGESLKEFKDKSGNLLGDTEKINIIKALQNTPEEIIIKSIKPNNGTLIQDFRRLDLSSKNYFPQSNFLIIKINYREEDYTFEAVRDRVKSFKNSLKRRGGKANIKKGGFGAKNGETNGNNASIPQQQKASTSPSPPPPPPQQYLQQPPSDQNQDSINNIKNEFLKLEKFNTTLEKYKLSKKKDLSGIIKLYSDDFKKMKKKFDVDNYNKDNYQELCKDFNEIYQKFKYIKTILNDPRIKEAGEYQSKFAKSIDDFVSKISGNFDDPKLKDALNNENTDSVIENIINAIYKFIIFIIAIASVIIVILNILNIIRYLYECFKEIGNLNHNNLSTGNTFRYKLFKYLFYIDSCSIPAIINQYNTPGASSGTLITLTTAISKFTLDFGNFFERNSIEGEEGYKVSDKVQNLTSKLGQDGMRESLYNFKFMDNATNELIEEQISNYKLNIPTDRIDKWKDENKDRKNEKEDVIRDELANKYRESLEKEYRETVKNNNEPFFNIFFMLRLNFFVIRLVITLINIFFVATLILIILKLINEKKQADIHLMPNLERHISSIFVISVFFVIINIVLYKFIYIKIYEKQLNTYLYIHSIDLRITEFITINKDSTGITTIDKKFYNILKNNIDNKGLILSHINSIIVDDQEKTDKEKKSISHIMLYVLVLHIYNSFEKRKNSHLDVLNNFVISPQNTDIFNINGNNFKEDTYYSFIGSKFRKESIQYFEDDIDNIAPTNIATYNEIKVGVNKYIAELNDLIVIVNNEFYDDYYIIQFGVYFLINLVISVIYIITLMGLAMQISAICQIFKGEKCPP